MIVFESCNQQNYQVVASLFAFLSVLCVPIGRTCYLTLNKCVCACVLLSNAKSSQRRRQGVMGVSKHPLSRGLVVNCDRTTVKHAFQNTQNNCYQWLSNSSRVHQIRFGPRWGSLQRSPDPLAGLMEPTSKGRGGKETGKEGRGGRGRGGRDRE